MGDPDKAALLQAFWALTPEDIDALDRAESMGYMEALDLAFNEKTSTDRMHLLLRRTWEKEKGTPTDGVAGTPEGGAVGGTGENVQPKPEQAMMEMLSLMQRQLSLQQQELHLMTDRQPGERESRQGDTSAIKMTVRPPEPLEDGMTLKEFRRWEASWENYSQITKLSKKSDSDQVATFKSFCKPKFLQRLKYAIGISDDYDKDLK